LRHVTVPVVYRNDVTIPQMLAESNAASASYGLRRGYVVAFECLKWREDC
jgi:hypothetical protein